LPPAVKDQSPCICCKVDNIVKATVVLHNFCKKELGGIESINNTIYCPQGYTDSNDEENGLWRTEAEPFQSVGRLSSKHATTA
jgi:hypothetical protein